MNAPLPRWHADFDARAEAEAAERDAISIVSKAWEEGEVHPPQLVLCLSDGSLVAITWDSTYECRNIFRYADEYADALACTGAVTGLSETVLAPLVDEVYVATKGWERDNAEGEAPKYSYAQQIYGGGR